MLVETIPPTNMATVSSPLPRITIQFCTQCKWMLRAAYFAQELLSTFNTALGEVALQPSTGGTFIVEIFYTQESITTGSTGSDGEPLQVQKTVLWDRKVDGGFPETKELKRRVRDIIQPDRDLGHVDGKKKSTTNALPTTESSQQGEAEKVKPGKEATTILASSPNLDVTSSQVVNLPEERENDGIPVKRNADGTICDDCN